jgi:lipid-binding SYLF domain-containing protein
MKTVLRVLCVALLMVAVPFALADEEAKEEKHANKRGKIDARSDELLQDILAKSANAKELFADAMGYAIFDSTKAALGISGGGGSGVAVEKSSGERTYMKMATGGIGLGIGVKTYQVLMLFEKAPVFENFVDKGWQADAQAGAAAGSEGAAVETTFHNGMAVFVNTKKGLMASADISGTKYWKSDLND